MATNSEVRDHIRNQLASDMGRNYRNRVGKMNADEEEMIMLTMIEPRVEIQYGDEEALAEFENSEVDAEIMDMINTTLERIGLERYPDRGPRP